MIKQGKKNGRVETIPGARKLFEQKRNAQDKGTANSRVDSISGIIWVRDLVRARVPADRRPPHAANELTPRNLATIQRRVQTWRVEQIAPGIPKYTPEDKVWTSTNLCAQVRVDAVKDKEGGVDRETGEDGYPEDERRCHSDSIS